MANLRIDERADLNWATQDRASGSVIGAAECTKTVDPRKDAGQVPHSYAVENRLRAENEALRQIIRGYQALLNLTV